MMITGVGVVVEIIVIIIKIIVVIVFNKYLKIDLVVIF